MFCRVAHLFFSFFIPKIIQRMKGSGTAAPDQLVILRPVGDPLEAGIETTGGLQ